MNTDVHAALGADVLRLTAEGKLNPKPGTPAGDAVLAAQVAVAARAERQRLRKVVRMMLAEAVARDGDDARAVERIKQLAREIAGT